MANAFPVKRKHGNIPTKGPTPDGGQREYPSKREASHAVTLDLLCKVGEIRSWQPQYPIPLIVNGMKVGLYIVDFRVETKAGKVEFHEIKGRQNTKDTAYNLWLLKAKIAEATLGVEILVNP